MNPSLTEMFRRLLKAEGQTRAAKSVEVFGWLIFVESVILMLAPHFAAELLHLPALVPQGANYLRLVALLVGGVGMLYIVSGRLNAEGFVFASLLDRPLVPPVMAVLWYLGIIPGPLALLFAVQDFGVFSGHYPHGARSRASWSRCRSEGCRRNGRTLIRNGLRPSHATELKRWA